MSAVEARPSNLPVETLPQATGAPRPPPTLARVVLQHTLLAACAVLLLALLLGLLNAQQETSDEVDSALATARLSRYLGNLPQLSDAQALAVLRHSSDLRHLRLRVTDGEGQTRIGAELPVSATERSIAWTVARPDGPAWTVTLVAAPAAGWLAQTWAALRTLLWLGLALAVVLAALAWSLARALAPSQGLLAALRALQRRDPSLLPALPPQPVAELEALRGGLVQLSGMLSEAEQSQRQCTRQLLAWQEAERGRLAQQLAADVGEPLGPMRLDAVWLRRQLAGNVQFEPVVRQMLLRLSQLSHGLERLLAHLNPLQLRPAGAGAASEHPNRLRDLLQNLIDDGLQREAGQGRLSLDFESTATSLPRELLLAVLRMSHEALRQLAGASCEHELTLRVRIDGVQGCLHWSVHDEAPGRDTDRLPAAALQSLQTQARVFGGELGMSPGPSGRGRVWRAVMRLDE